MLPLFQHNSLFSLYFFEINIYFIKALYQFIVLSFPSYHPFSKNSSTFKAVVSCISLYISTEYTCILVSCLSIVDTAYLFHILQLKSHIICTTTTTIPLILFPHLSDILTSEFLAKSVIFVHTLYLFYTVYIVFVEKFFFFSLMFLHFLFAWFSAHISLIIFNYTNNSVKCPTVAFQNAKAYQILVGPHFILEDLTPAPRTASSSVGRLLCHCDIHTTSTETKLLLCRLGFWFSGSQTFLLCIYSHIFK